MAALETKKVSILGSTGSIGQSTVDVIKSNPDAFDVQVLTANNNAQKLAEQARALNAKKAVVANEDYYNELAGALSGTGIEVAAGAEAVIEAAAMPADVIMNGVVGVVGLRPVMEALKQGTSVAIANKEPLVAAGALVKKTAEEHGTTIIPVDSEHNGIFQVFDKSQQDEIIRVVLTASGGPFLSWDLNQMRDATVKQAIAHPRWSMGAKISVDSATMMNKALEVIEAHYLFDMRPTQIDVIVHPQSTIHAMVEYSDGSVLAHMGASDMHTPITHALSYPQRMKTPGNGLDWFSLMQLDFKFVDTKRFPSIPKAYECLEEGPHACVAFNASNEVAVQAFLDKKIGFLDIYDTVNRCVNAAKSQKLETLDDILAYDEAIRADASELILKKSA